MAVESGNSVAVDDSAAVQLSSAAVPFGARHTVTIVNSGSDVIYVGDADVDDSGFPLAAGGALNGELEPHEELWGICAAAESSTFDYLHTGV